MSSLQKAATQKQLTRDTVDAQFCSDWLKGEIKRLFDELDLLRVHEGRRKVFREKCQLAAEALEEIGVRDFRGNRPQEQQLAWQALQKIKALL